MATFVRIPIIESARRVGLHLRERTIGRIEVEALCPFCGDSKYHLSLNTHTDQFHCHLCKASGNSITLYAKLMNVDNSTAYEELQENRPYLFPEPLKPIIEREPAPLYFRHDVYYDLLRMLELSDKHRDNLRARGLSDERITRNMYRSVPMGSAYIKDVLENLTSLYDLTGVPGFYTKDGRWRMYGKPGFFVPVCTPEGYIQGLQVRLDDADNRKYRWFSSRYWENGTRAYPWVHVTGNRESDTAVITEGALKADVASSLSKDALFVSVPGINCLRGLPDVLKNLKITKVVEAFDMDKFDKPQVAQAIGELQRMVYGLGLEYVPCNWNPSYKGIDDYLLSRIAV